jgi:hypothetical protein
MSGYPQISNPEAALNGELVQYVDYGHEINQNYGRVTDIKNEYHVNLKALQANNPKYDFSGNTLQLPGHTKPNILDAVTQDTNLYVLQENTAYIVGSITMATFLILAIMIGSE